jgi:hypothetical protein
VSGADFFLAQYDTGNRTSVYAAPLSESLRTALAQDGATLVPVWTESALAAERARVVGLVETFAEQAPNLYGPFGRAGIGYAMGGLLDALNESTAAPRGTTGGDGHGR